MKDQLVAHHKFSEDVAAALNAAKVVPVSGFGHACLVVTYKKDEPHGGAEPIGGEVNFDTEKGRWVATQEARHGDPIPS